MAMHKDLLVWQKSMDLVTQIYALTQKFPREEIFGLANQMRRCAVSIPSNIAEGYGRSSDKEIIHFLYIALGSASELETQLLIAKNLEFIPPNLFDETIDQLNDVLKMLPALIKSINRTTPNL